MPEQKERQQVEELQVIGSSNKGSVNISGWWLKIVSLLAILYLSFSLVSPMFLEKRQQPLRKIEIPDLILGALVFLFNSELFNRLEDFGITKDGDVTAKF